MPPMFQRTNSPIEWSEGIAAEGDGGVQGLLVKDGTGWKSRKCFPTNLIYSSFGTKLHIRALFVVRNSFTMSL